MTDMSHQINEMKRKHEHAVRVQEIQSQLEDYEGEDFTRLGELVLEVQNICNSLNLSQTSRTSLLDQTKLKAFADDKLIVTKMITSVFDRVENIVGKGEIACTSRPEFYQS